MEKDEYRFTIKYDIHVLCTELNNGLSVEKGQKNYKSIVVNSNFWLLSSIIISILEFWKKI